MKSVLIFIFVTGLSTAYASGKLRCPLKWVPFGSDLSVPEHAIVTDESIPKLYIIRSYQLSGIYAGGAMESKQVPENNSTVGGKGYIYDSPTLQYEYEILTNPHECTLNWVQAFQPDTNNFKIPISSDRTVGRTTVGDRIVAGAISGSEMEYYYESYSSTTTLFDVLISYSSGLEMKMSHFQLFVEVEPNTMEVLGLDEINNLANTEIRQTITHRKKVVEEFTLKQEKEVSWSTAVVSRVYVITYWECIQKGYWLTTTHFQSGSESWSREWSEKVESEVTISREIVVPAFSNIQVCTAASVITDYESRYEARMDYEIPGWTAAEVYEYITEGAGWDDIYIVDGVVAKNVTGTFQASMYFNTKLIVTAGDAQESCVALHRASKERQRKLAINLTT